MDLVASLASAMGVDHTKAQAVAGLVLGAAKEQAGGDEAEKLAAEVPELDGWVAQAKESVPTEDQDGVFDDVGRFANSALGGSLLGAVVGEEGKNKAQAIALLGQLGLEPSHAALAAPVLMSFLEQRLGNVWLERLLAAAPLLVGLRQASSPDSGGLAGALGSLFGR